jgi:hypothetical protein
MYDFHGFDELKVGRRVKVKGTPGADGTFSALEIAIKESKDEAEVEGVIQELDPAARRLRVVNMDFELPADIVVKDLMKNEVGLDALAVGDLVKVKGGYHPGSGFVPVKVKRKESPGFAIEEVQGVIDSVDEQNHRFETVGLTVVVSDRTSIEGDGS